MRKELEASKRNLELPLSPRGRRPKGTARLETRRRPPRLKKEKAGRFAGLRLTIENR
jgi:hypothetical protein